METPTFAIDTEQLPGMDGGTRGVSTIAISFQLLEDREIQEWEAPRPKEEAPEAVEPEAAEPSQYEIFDVKGIGKATNEKLEEVGVDSVEALAFYDLEGLSEKMGISAKTCAKLVEAAKELMK